MGQYWHAVNLDKKEYINPHKLASGLKIWEQLANPGVGQALVILLAAQRETRGGGDLDMEKNWHGPERKLPQHNTTPGPMPNDYPDIAARTIGRWAGDRVAFVGDYAEDDDLPKKYQASKIYGKCCSEDGKPSVYQDITDYVAIVIEHELHGKFGGTGWKEWKPLEDSATA